MSKEIAERIHIPDRGAVPLKDACKLFRSWQAEDDDMSDQVLFLNAGGGEDSDDEPGDEESEEEPARLSPLSSESAGRRKENEPRQGGE